MEKETDPIVTKTVSEGRLQDTAVNNDRQVLVSNDSISSDDDSDYNTPFSQTSTVRSHWWFQEPAVKSNQCVVIGTWILLCLGVLAVITGIVLEIIKLNSGDLKIRGVIFLLIGIVMLIPSVYAVTHIYLAAKRIGRVRFSSVWFFR